MPDLSGREIRVNIGRCVWCSKVSTSLFMAEGLGRELPLHPTCAVKMVYVYNRWRRGIMLDADRERALRVYGPPPQFGGRSRPTNGRS